MFASLGEKASNPAHGAAQQVSSYQFAYLDPDELPLIMRFSGAALRSMVASRAASTEGALIGWTAAELELSYTRVYAPFDGQVVGLNLSEGYYAHAGMEGFGFLDSRKWYVLANFRERELKSIRPGMTAEIYLWSNPDRRFEGTVEGMSPAVVSQDDNTEVNGVPSVQRDLNWVRIAQRFPVRIVIENPDPSIFRMGTTAVTTIKGFTRTAGNKPLGLITVTEPQRPQ